MTDNLSNYKAEIDKAIEQRGFNALYSLFTRISFSLNELLIFFRQKNGSQVSSKQKLFALKEFWTSQLPHFHLKGILESDIKVDFLRCYFSDNEFCNPELDRHLIVLAKDDYVKHFKLWKAFERPNFLSSLQQLGQSDPDLGRTAREIEIVIKANERLKSEEKDDDIAFMKFNLGEVLFAFTLYFQEFKRSEQVAGNRSWQTKVEMVLIDYLNHIFSIFKGQPNLNFGFSSKEGLQKQFQISDSQSTPHIKAIFDLIESLIDRRIQETRIELYLCGYSDFLSSVLYPAIFKTNENYRVFNFNNKKTTPEELFFHQGSQIISRTDVAPGMKNLLFNGIPESINTVEGSIGLKKVLELLKYFSVFKGPVERVIIQDRGYFVRNKADDKFIELFGSNESITLFGYDELIKGIAKYFNWTTNEAKSTLSFLTLDLDTQQFHTNWLHSPFLKLNSQILWLGSLLKDRRWEIILLNKLKKEFAYHSLVNVISKNFEQRIEEIFIRNSFKTLCGESFRSSNGQVGDFDVLAFKDNYLFVCEAKIGVRSDSFNHAAHSEIVRLEGLAAGQLKKAIFNIQEDWANIKAKLGIDEAVSLNSVKIVPLIVTDFFEGDLHPYKSGVRKISLLELDVILKNKKRELLEIYIEQYPLIAESLNPNTNWNRNIISNWDLWEGKKVLTSEIILRNIEQNSIWKELETVWKFEDEEYLLEY